MTEFWDKSAEKSGKVLAAFLEGLPLTAANQFERMISMIGNHTVCLPCDITPAINCRSHLPQQTRKKNI